MIQSPTNDVIKVVDLGTSNFADRQLYTNIQSKYYRSPEVILQLPYGAAIDTWSIACILFEMLTGKTLFKGKDDGEQMRLIMELLGVPP